MTTSTIRLLLVTVLVVAVVVTWPLLFIWALNTLFSLAIPFSFKTWLATAVISALFAPKRSSSND